MSADSDDKPAWANHLPPFGDLSSVQVLTQLIEYAAICLTDTEEFSFTSREIFDKISDLCGPDAPPEREDYYRVLRSILSNPTGCVRQRLGRPGYLYLR